ncbi:MAG: glycosyltransferase [Patescibacteria group bacterium]|nr:glycosyltransferase [Patescibacteria group bacterium]
MDISVIIPAYNEEKYIEPCLRSIKRQKTDLKYELIVVDSKCTDKTVEIAKKYTDNIVVAKKGIAPARNAGASIAKGKILVFIDADTQIAPDYLEFIFKKFKQDSLLIGLSTSFKFSKQTPELIFAQEITNGYLVMRSELEKATLPGFNTCVLKSKFEKVGGYKNCFLEDINLSRDLILLGKIKYFSNKKVITSSRKLEKWGTLGVLRYYFELEVIKKNIDLPFERINKVKDKILKKALKHKTWKNVR